MILDNRVGTAHSSAVQVMKNYSVVDIFLQRKHKPGADRKDSS